MDFTRFNKKNFSKIDWGIKTDNLGFKKISELYADGIKKVQVFGFFFIKSSFGIQPIAITKDCLLNLPTQKKDIISEMLKDKDVVESIKKGECGLTFSTYQGKYSKECFDVDFINYEKTAEQPIF